MPAGTAPPHDLAERRTVGGASPFVPVDVAHSLRVRSRGPRRPLRCRTRAPARTQIATPEVRDHRSPTKDIEATEKRRDVAVWVPEHDGARAIGVPDVGDGRCSGGADTSELASPCGLADVERVQAAWAEQHRVDKSVRTVWPALRHTPSRVRRTPRDCQGFDKILRNVAAWSAPNQLLLTSIRFGSGRGRG